MSTKSTTPKTTNARKTKAANNKRPNTMSSSKKGIICLIAAIVIAALAATGLILLNSESDQKKTEDTMNETEEIAANCDVLECVKKIEVTTPIEEVTKIIGVEPEKDEYQDRYSWKLSKKESISMTKYGSENYILQATIDKERIANDQVDFSIFTELKKLLENGTSFTYEELVEKLGGIEGTLDGKTISSDSYIWVDKNGQTLGATFSDDTGKCSIASLR